MTLPQRVAAALNLLTYDKTLDDVMYVLLEETRRAVHDLQQTMGSDLPVSVCSADELLQQASAYPGFDVFYEAAKQASFVALQEGSSTYVEETIHLLEQILDFTGMTAPMPSSPLRRPIIQRLTACRSRRRPLRACWKNPCHDGCPLRPLFQRRFRLQLLLRRPRFR